MSRPQIRPDLRALSGYFSPQIDVEVRLNTNESPFPPPQGYDLAVADALKELRWNRYPDRAISALRSDLGRLHGVGSDQIFVANGSNEGLQALMLAFGGHGRSALTFEPTYALHAHISRITGTTVHQQSRDADFAIDQAAALDFIGAEQPDVVFLCSPNNPSGLPESPALIGAVIAAASGVVVVDEAYGQFAEFSAATLLEDDIPLVIARTFSKTWAMAAARLGYLIAPAWLVAELEKVILPYHVDTLSQVAGRIALRFDDEMQERVALLTAERDRISVGIAQLGSHVWPSQANFVLFRPAAGRGEAVWQSLVDQSVLVRNCSTWPGLAGCLRVTVGTAAENNRFLEALEISLADQGGVRE